MIEVGLFVLEDVVFAIDRRLLSKQSCEGLPLTHRPVWDLLVDSRALLLQMLQYHSNYMVYQLEYQQVLVVYVPQTSDLCNDFLCEV